MCPALHLRTQQFIKLTSRFGLRRCKHPRRWRRSCVNGYVGVQECVFPYKFSCFCLDPLASFELIWRFNYFEVSVAKYFSVSYLNIKVNYIKSGRFYAYFNDVIGSEVCITCCIRLFTSKNWKHKFFRRNVLRHLSNLESSGDRRLARKFRVSDDWQTALLKVSKQISCKERHRVLNLVYSLMYNK